MRKMFSIVSLACLAAAFAVCTTGCKSEEDSNVVTPPDKDAQQAVPDAPGDTLRF